MIKYVTGDLLKSSCTILCHQVNCKGVMGSGLAKQIKNKYPHVYKEYKFLCDTFMSKHLLGEAQYISCDDGHIIANLFSQNDYGKDKFYTNYEALNKCIEDVYCAAAYKNMSVAFPYLLGCDRGGGDWNIVEKIIETNFKDNNLRCEIVSLQT
jgi:O-acetyl-ADP-ribose deacetylase (regulator of RNase III)